MRNATLLALVTLVALIALACGDDSDDPSPSATSTALPAEDATAAPDGSSVFPVVLESETLIVARADGSGITETPLKPGERPLFGGAAVSPDGARTATIEDGTLFVQEGDGEPTPILEIPSLSNYLNFSWSPDSSRILFSTSFDEAPTGVYVINVDGSGLTALSEGAVGNAHHHAWSADGTLVAFGAFPPEGGAAQMYVTRADGTERTLLGEYFPPQGDSPWDSPTWSQDGARIVAVHGGGLRIFDIARGTVRDLPGTQTLQFSWSPDGRFLVFDSWDEGASTRMLMVVDVTASAEPRLLVEGHFPRWSPDGERIAFERGDVYTIRPDGSDEVALAAQIPGFRYGRTWSEDGRDVVWVQGAPSVQHLYAIDLRDGAVVRTPGSLTEAGYQGPGFLDMELAPNAEQIAFQVSAGKEGQFAPGWYTMVVDTGELGQITDGYSENDVFWSPEGIRLVSGDLNGVFVAEGDRSPRRQVSDVEASTAVWAISTAVWSPDGTRIAFGSEAGIHVLDADGTNNQFIDLDLAVESDGVVSIEWSSDGLRLLYEVIRQTSTGIARETFLADLDGSRPVTLLDAEAMAGEATWSPDGETIAYARGSDGAAEVWLIDPAGTNSRLLTGFESSSVSALRWSPDGASIAVVIGSDVYVIDVETGSSLLVATNSEHCAVNLLGWSPDSQRLFAVPFCQYLIL